MKQKRYSDEQITYALRQAEGGTAVAEVCRQLGVSEASFYLWKKKYGKLGMTEIRELRQLRDENARLKRLVADLTLDKHILGKSSEKNSEASAPSRAGPVDSRALSGGGPAILPPGALLTCRVVRPEPSARSVSLAAEDPRARAQAAAV